jgi:2-dehydro-3-deoxyphosphogluconate aldolase / (4S)-4-hydroxy-2-oxoglutarate aldolase
MHTAQAGTSTVQQLFDIGVIPVVRLDDLRSAIEIARALGAGGVPAVEYTLTNPEAVDAIERVREAVPDLLVGAGTVLDGESARRCIDAGAQYLITPAVAPSVIEAGTEADVPVICGALTPTEILTAWRLGASCIKVFPAGTVGPSYIKAVLAPLPQIPLMPSGGVSVNNAADFIRAGARAVSVGDALVGRDLVARGEWGEISARARAFHDAVAEARDEKQV